MPNNGHEKTKSAPKTFTKHYSRVVVILSLFLGFFAILLGLTFLLSKDDAVRLRTAQKTYTLETAQTPEEQARGLGGRSTLFADYGMIFIYPTEARRCFWMKDTQFSLDMIWLDSSYKVTHVEPLVTPETYPMSFCGDDAQYVIELPAGAAAQTQVSVGQVLDLKHMP